MEAKLNNTYLFKKFTLSADIQTNDLFAVGGRGYGPLQQGVFHGYPLKSPKAPGGTFFYQTLQTMLSLALPRLEKKHLPTDYVCGFTAIKQYNVRLIEIRK